jgi:hypothetical protein
LGAPGEKQILFEGDNKESKGKSSKAEGAAVTHRSRRKKKAKANAGILRFVP